MASRRRDTRSGSGDAPADAGEVGPGGAAGGVDDFGDLERLLYRGRYAEVLRESERQGLPTGPIQVGALALSGRLDETEIAAKRLLAAASADGRVAAAVRFFVCAGLCHAGRLPHALATARAALPTLRSNDPRARYFGYQALALVRFFEGKMAASRRLSRRALACAMEADFSYGRLLALDLRGHGLVESGQVFAGLRMLEQAEDLGRSLGFDGNADAIRASITCITARCGIGDRRVLRGDLRALATRADLPFFARRNSLIELTWLHALAGEPVEARIALDEAEQIALPDRDRRARVRLLLARAVVVGLSDGRDAAGPLLEEAEREASDDCTLEVETAFLRTLVLGMTRPEDAAAAGPRASATGFAHAAAIASLVSRAAPTAIRHEDRFTELLLRLPHAHLEQQLGLLTELDCLALLPLAAARTPGVRLWIIGAQLVAENHGSIAAGALPSGPSLAVLRLLAGGPQTKEALVSRVWRIRTYAARLHDPPLQTAVARLRQSLGPRAALIETTADGYGLARGVDLVDPDAIAPANGGEPAPPSERPPADPSLDDRLCQVLRREGPVTSVELARSVRVSESSVLRALRRLVEVDTVQRTGRGKGTRYALTRTVGP